MPLHDETGMTFSSLTTVARPPAPSALSNALVFGWRAVLKFKHVPEQLFDLVMTPIMFTLLFTFVFGGALAGSVSAYLQFFLPGILVQTVCFNAVYSGMGLSTDLGKGLFDRFRSLPIWSLAPFAGLMVGDILRHLIAATIILTIGLILGYRPEAGIAGVIAAFALLVAIGFGMGWVFIVLGLMIRTPTTVMTLGFTFLFPLVFASNIMVEPATMPGWLRMLVEVNPVSLMTTAMRGLMGGGATMSQIALALILPAVLTATLAPVTLWLYRRQ
jgi:ABC-2 type transport system permease protein